MNVPDLSLEQLKLAVTLREQIESLQNELREILAGSKVRGMSAAGRARIAEAQKARWAKLKGAKSEKSDKGRRKMSANTKARMAAAARARWKKAKAAGKNKL